MFFIGISNIILPYCPNVKLLYAVSFLTGIGTGMINSGCILLIVEIWKAASGPYMHALHFAYAFGTSIAPLLAKPFLLSNVGTVGLEVYENSTDQHNTTKNYFSTTTSETIDGTYWNIKTLYAIVGTYNLLAVL